jgi:Abnormal spindle-like microcephaly-assoc'd, ASPM-SPD-2-Hydin/Immunoglobulin domain
MGSVKYSRSRVKKTFGRAILGATILLAIGTTLQAFTFTISPNPINFGNQAVGTNTSLNVTLTNGTHGKIKIVSVSSSPAQFSYSGPPLPVTLQPGQSMSAAVEFTPTAAQTFNGTLTFTRANGSAITASLNGFGVQPVAPPSIATQPVSRTVTAGQTATFSVSATGTAPLSYQWGKNGTAISGATSPSYTTPATTSSDNGEKYTVVVGNSMGSATSNAATLTVTTPGYLTDSASSLGFGNVNVGSSSTQSVTLTNSGGSNVSVANVTISGAGFSVNAISTGLILAPTASVAMNVTFAPAASGGVTGTVAITSNASNSPLTVSFSGTGQVVAHSATLAWTESSTVIGYNVYRGSVSGGPYTKINPSLDATTSFADTTVQAGQTYYWVVTAVNSSNVESTYSNQIGGTIPTP